jgi:hypothetical protein
MVLAMNRVLFFLAAIGWNATASAQSYQTRVGTLACDASAGVSTIVTSKKSIACVFTPAQPGPREIYSATIEKAARDATGSATAELLWTVVASHAKRFGALAGRYGGASADAGENALIGGENRSVILLPVSLEGESSVNLASGVSGLELRPAR